MATLFQKLGGQTAVGSVVDKFYEYMLADEITAPFFANTDMTKQKQQQKNFIGMVCGGPANYEGADMKKAHEKMKISDKEFDATWNNLLKSLNDHKVPENLSNELKEVFYSVHDDVITVK